MSQPVKSSRTPATPDAPESAAGSRAAAQRLKMRRELAAAAMELFATKGYEATTVDEIAAAAGVARRTFFRHFRSKEEAIFPDHDDTLIRAEAVLNAAPAHEHPLDTVCRGIKEVMKMYAARPEISVSRYKLTREVPIPNRNPNCARPEKSVDNVVALNADLRRALASARTPLANYQLIDTQWPIPSASHGTVFDVRPRRLANTTMESFAQQTSSCMGCHAMARSLNPEAFVSADFSFTLNNALPRPRVPSPFSPAFQPAICAAFSITARARGSFMCASRNATGSAPAASASSSMKDSPANTLA